MTNPQASVIICVYNRAEQMQDCLDAVLAMDASDYEIVIVDDASTDDTPHFLERFRLAHPDRQITIVRAEHNCGVSGARNLGIHAARGDVVFFTDSDCIVDPAWLRLMLEKLKAGKATAVAGRVTIPTPTNLAERAYAGTSRLHGHPRQDRVLSGGNMGLYRDVARAYLFDEALTYGCDEDDLAWRLRHDGHRIAFSPDAIVLHDHPYTLRSYLRTAYRQGIGAARYWFKRGQYVGRDVLCTLAAVVTLPFALIDPRILFMTAALLALQLLALLYNEMAFKGKSAWETATVLPICILHNACKSAGVARTLLALLFGGERPIRESRKRWRSRRPAPTQTNPAETPDAPVEE